MSSVAQRSAHADQRLPRARIVGLDLTRPYLFGIVGALILCAFAVLNGAPHVWYDTPSYISRGERALLALLGEVRPSEWSGQATAGPSSTPQGFPRIFVAGRSVYYGLVAYASYIVAGFWPLVLLKGWLVGTLSALLLQRCWSLHSPILYGAVMAALALGTPLAVVTGTVMPDVLASVLILGFAILLAYHARLLPLDRIFVAGAATFAIVSHNSHVAIACGLMVLIAAIILLDRQERRKRIVVLLIVGGCIAAGIAAEMAFWAASIRISGAPPIQMPFITAHLVDMGPGYRFLVKSCATTAYEVCNHLDRLPTNWITFLFDGSPEAGVFGAANEAAKRRLSQEQYGLAVQIFLDQPGAVAGGLAREVLAQVASFSFGDLRLLPDHPVIRQVPEVIRVRLENSFTQQHPGALEAFSVVVYTVFLAALTVVPIAAWRLKRSSHPEADRLLLLTLVIMLGVIGNAVVCAVLASPSDRFQNRVVWLVPFLALALLLRLRSSFHGRRELVEIESADAPEPRRARARSHSRPLSPVSGD